MFSAFKHALKKDRETHGLSTAEYEVDNGDGPVDEIQQNADDAIEAANRIAEAARVAATAATANATPIAEDENDGESSSGS